MDEIEVLRRSLESVADLESSFPPRNGLLIGLCNTWRVDYWEPYMVACNAQASREQGKEVDLFYRNHGRYEREARLQFLSQVLGRKLSTTNDLKEEEAKCIERWLQGHHPNHYCYDEETRELSVEDRAFEVQLWLDFNKEKWCDV